MTDQVPIKRALVSVYDKTGLEELVRGPARRRRRAGLDRRLGGADRAASASRSPRSRTSPASPSASTAGSRRCTRGCTPASSPTAASTPTSSSSPTSASSRSTWSSRNLYPFVADGRVGREPRRVRRADRHRRPVDGARRRQEPPLGRDRHLAGQLPGGARGGRRRRLHARPAAAAGRRGVRAHRDVRRRRGLVDGQRAHRHLRRHRLPGLGRRHLGQVRGAALRREPAPERRALPQRLRDRSRPGRAAARQGDVLQQLRRRRRRPARGVRLRRAGGRDHQARQPVRDRGRRRRRRGAPQGARVRPGLGVRRRDRDQRAGLGRDGAPGGRGVHRGRRGAGVRRRRGRDPRRARRTSGCWSASRWAGARSRSGRSPAAC